MTLLAHGIGGVRDLPVPDWLFFWGGAVVLVLSFLALGMRWRPVLERLSAGRPLPMGLERVLRSTALRFVLGAFSVALLALVFLTALLGEPSSAVNLAPTFVYVVFWLGVVVLQVVLGNVWPVLNPWLAVADAVAWCWGRLGRTWEPLATYPERLGVYPAAILLFAFTTLELAYNDPANPRSLALAVALYSYVTWFGMATFGQGSGPSTGMASRFTSACSRASRPSASMPVASSCVPRSAASPGRTGDRGRSSSSPSCSARSVSTASPARRSGRTCGHGSRADTCWTHPASRISSGPCSPSVGCRPVCSLSAPPTRRRRLARLGARRPGDLWPEFLRGLIPIALVYAGGRARRGARRRARRRARPRDRDPPAARRATVPVRDARADGALYGWWSVVALAGVATLLAHGGVGGAVVETLLVVSIAGVFLILWLRERRTRDETPDDDPV